MAGLIRSLFKGKKGRKENKDETGNVEDYLVFHPCSRSASMKRQPTARFADDCMLPATAAYHTTSAPRLRKGPQSCPGGKEEDFRIDASPEKQRRHHQSHRDLTRRDSKKKHPRDSNDSDDESEDVENIYERKSQYYMQKYEDSERQRREDRRKQEKLGKERNNIQHAMANMAYCMASAQQMEQLKKERDQYKKEATRYKNKCEKLENKFEAMSPSFGALQAFTNPSPYHTPHFPPAPLSFQYPNPMMPSNPMTSAPQTFVNPTGPLLSNNHHRSVDFLNNNGQQLLPPPLRFAPIGNMNNNHGGSTSFTMSNSPTTIGSDGGGGGAGESLVNPADCSFLGDFKFNAASNQDDSDEDDVKNYRYEDAYFAPSPLSELTQSTADNF